ncbi:MAG TPA: hypothetical protein VEG35_05600 [Burkholderiales bacterium]|nr:hypothetical protein [Burkholderiales bacterium]
MSDRRYQTAAWLVFVKMAIQLGFFVVAIILMATNSWKVGPVTARGFFLILAGLISCYVLFVLRRLLWDRYDFHKLDVVIPVVAVADVVLEILNQFTEVAQVIYPANMGVIVAVRILFIVVPWGIINIVFAAGLLKLPFSEKSLLRPFAYLYLAAGIVLVSMVLVLASPVFAFILLPLLIITGVGSDVLLALTFLRSRETEQVEFV